MELYHGSSVEVQYPEVRKAKFTKDFSWGFYCTNSYNQARRWAKQRGRNKQGIVNVYEYKTASGLNIKSFPEMSDEWLDFIIACRSGKPHQHDIVIGAMANDQIYNYVSDYIDGVITREQFWMLAKFKYPTHQINFCTEQALSCLAFYKSEAVRK